MSKIVKDYTKCSFGYVRDLYNIEWFVTAPAESAPSRRSQATRRKVASAIRIASMVRSGRSTSPSPSVKGKHIIITLFTSACSGI